VKKLCYVSSTAAIGGKNHTLISEAEKWEQSPETSGYSISKYSAEKEVWRGVEEGLDCVIVNPSVIFGAGNWDESSMTIFRTLDRGLNFYTSGKNGFVDARDVAEIMDRLANSEIKNERFLCVGHSVFFKDLFEKIALKMNKRAPRISTPRWLLGASWRISGVYAKLSGKKSALTKDSAQSTFNVKEYDSTKIKTLLGFEFRSLDDTIGNTINGRIL
jgi:nucleoside-diphosphate-sugar epimerase